VILFDGELRELSERFASHKTLVVTLDEPADLSGYGQVMEHTGARTTLRIERSRTAAVTAQLLSEHDVRDLTVEDPPIDDVIELAFASGTTST
jgi:ABC-2 type transport system ATP-binding protein